MRRWMMHLETHHHVGLHDGRITCTRCSLGQNVRHPEAGATTAETRDHHNEFACNTSFEHGDERSASVLHHAQIITHHHASAHMWRTMREGIVQPVGQSITLLAQWQWMDTQNNEGEVDEPGASVGNGVEKLWTQLWVKQGEVKHG